MDAIMCATMATNLAELRHYYSHGHHMDRQSLVRICFGCRGDDALIIMSLERKKKSGNYSKTRPAL